MIGVIGGNGVAATNKLLSLIEENKTINGAFRDAHHPEMLIWQATQAPSRSMFLKVMESVIEDYVRIGIKMKGCDCIVAGCTDIRNVYKYNSMDISYIDSLEVLANSIFMSRL